MNQYIVHVASSVPNHTTPLGGFDHFPTHADLRTLGLRKGEAYQIMDDRGGVRGEGVWS